MISSECAQMINVGELGSGSTKWKLVQLFGLCSCDPNEWNSNELEITPHLLGSLSACHSAGLLVHGMARTESEASVTGDPGQAEWLLQSSVLHL